MFAYVFFIALLFFLLMFIRNVGDMWRRKTKISQLAKRRQMRENEFDEIDLR